MASGFSEQSNPSSGRSRKEALPSPLTAVPESPVPLYAARQLSNYTKMGYLNPIISLYRKPQLAAESPCSGSPDYVHTFLSLHQVF